MTGMPDTRMIQLVMALRRAGVSDKSVLMAVERTPRELFVPQGFADQAFENRPLPIDCGQTISQPFVVAAMTEALKLNDRCKVLEIGTGSGYQAAVLAQLSRRVYTVERYRTLAKEAEAALAKREEELRRLRGEKARALADAADRIALLESDADEAREAVEDARASAERREREAEAAQRVWATLEATLREQIEAYELERRRREEEGDLSDDSASGGGRRGGTEEPTWGSRGRRGRAERAAG